MVLPQIEDPKGSSYPQWIDKLIERKRFFSLLIVGMFVVGFLIAETPFFLKKKRKNVVQMQRCFESWQQSPAETALVQQMQELLGKNGALAPKYAGKFLQSRLMQITKTSLEQTAAELSRFYEEKADPLPLFRQFGKISILMAAEKYTEALEQSLLLQEALQKNSKQAPQLQAHNFLRMALLHQKLQQKDKEHLAWKALKHYLDTLDTQPLYAGEKQKFLQAFFNEREVSFMEYLENNMSP